MLVDILASLPFMTSQRAHIVMDAFLPMIKGGLLYSIPLSLISFVIGIAIALVVAVIRIMPRQSIWHKAFYFFVRAYVSAIRGTPMLVQLFVIFYGLPSIGIKLDPFLTAVIAFSLNVGAYASETLRASILSIGKGQWEAGSSVGMTYFQTFRYVILPQSLRVAIPPLSNTYISLIKETSLASLVLVTELFKEAQIVAARTYEFMLIYIEAGLIYWVICFVLSLFQQYLENRFDKHLVNK